MNLELRLSDQQKLIEQSSYYRINPQLRQLTGLKFMILAAFLGVKENPSSKGAPTFTIPLGRKGFFLAGYAIGRVHLQPLTKDQQYFLNPWMVNVDAKEQMQQANRDQRREGQFYDQGLLFFLEVLESSRYEAVQKNGQFNTFWTLNCRAIWARQYSL